jgi:hypothetical protein
MSEQQEAVAGTSSRQLPYAAPIYNCLKLWAFQLNSTLAAAACCRPRPSRPTTGSCEGHDRQAGARAPPDPGKPPWSEADFPKLADYPCFARRVNPASPPDAGPPCAKKKALRQRDLATVHGVVFAILATACSCAGPLSQKPRDNPLKKCRIRQNREERHV